MKICDFIKPELESSMKKVCKEIKEFIQTLYNHSESQTERDFINNLISELQTELK